MKELYDKREELVKLSKPVLDKALDYLLERLTPIMLDAIKIKSDLVSTKIAHDKETKSSRKQFGAECKHQINDRTYNISIALEFTSYDRYRVELRVNDLEQNEIHNQMSAIELYAETLHNDVLYNLLVTALNDELEKLIEPLKEILEYEVTGCSNFLQNNKGFILETSVG